MQYFSAEKIEGYASLLGPACSPVLEARNQDGIADPRFRTLFVQEMLEHGVLIPWVAPCFRHGEPDIERIKIALQHTAITYRRALEDGCDRYLRGPVLKPVFRQWN